MTKPTKKYNNLIANLESSRALLEEETDPEMREMAKLEIEELETLRTPMEEEIKIMLIPKILRMIKMRSLN